MPEHFRLFVAISVPDAIKSTLQDVQVELQRRLPEGSIRWTPRDQIHLTLRFFGNVLVEYLADLKPRLEAACAISAPMRLRASGLGVFPERKPPRVLWVGVQDDLNQLAALQSAVVGATCDFGEKPDDRPFSAHLTLGRIKQLRPREGAALRQFIPREASRLCGEWAVNHLELIQSQLGPAGAKHSVIATYPLGHGEVTR